MDLAWASTETTPGVYNRSSYDELISALNSLRMRAILILDYNNILYTSGDLHFSPQDSTNVAAYERWAAANVKHFEGNNIIWEIWNEPNNSTFWKFQPNALQYTTMALAACKSIKRADSIATIIGPAADRFPIDLLTSVMTSGLIDYLNAVSVHPYKGNHCLETAPYYTPGSTNNRGYHWLESLITLYEPAGKNIPIVCSEWGYSSSSLPGQTQANYLARIQLFNLYNGLPISIWYDWTGGNSSFNIVNSDLSLRLPYVSATVLTLELNRYHVVSRYSTGNSSDIVLLFKNSHDSIKFTAWTTSRSHQVSIPLSVVSFPGIEKTICRVNNDADTGSRNVSYESIKAELTGTPKYYSSFQQVLDVPLPPALVLVSLVSNSFNLSRKISLQWKASTSYFSVKYNLQIAKDSLTGAGGAFKTQYIVLDTTIANTSMQITFALNSNTEYYRHVSAINLEGSGNYSSLYYFKTGTAISLPLVPKLVSPPAYVTGISLEPLFKWQRSKFANRYELQIASDYHIYTSGDSVTSFLYQNVIFDTTLTYTLFKLTFPLDSLTKYLGHVCAINSAGARKYSNDPLYFFKTFNTITEATKNQNSLPVKFAPCQNYPDPFNPASRIQYDLPESSHVKILVYDFLGRKVTTFVDNKLAPGKYSVEFNASGLPSGLYFLKMDAENYTLIIKMMLIK